MGSDQLDELDKLAQISYETELDDEQLLSPSSTNMKKTEDSRRKRLLLLVAIAIIVAATATGLVIFLRKRSNQKSTDSTNDVGQPTATGPVPSPSPTTASPLLRTGSPSSQPAGMPSILSTAPPTSAPTSSPTSLSPTASPSVSPTTATPTTGPTKYTTSAPTKNPSSTPTSTPSSSPSASPSTTPSSQPTAGPTTAEQITTFYAIADVPYTAGQAYELKLQIQDLPLDAEFLVHAGDLRKAADYLPCRRFEYRRAAEILQLSHVPVFVLIGDNDHNDCPDPEQGLEFWKESFMGFESRYWNHTFDIQKQPLRPENFAFAHKGTLFIGLTIMGGLVHSESEWSTRLTEQVEWTKDLMRTYVDNISPRVGRVVIFGHADPRAVHQEFFGPLTKFIQDELQNQVPILYLNGDRHEWRYEPDFYEQKSFLRIMLAAKAIDPPLKIMVHADGQPSTTADAFAYDRRLS